MLIFYLWKDAGSVTVNQFFGGAYSGIPHSALQRFFFSCKREITNSRKEGEGWGGEKELSYRLMFLIFLLVLQTSWHL